MRKSQGLSSGLVHSEPPPVPEGQLLCDYSFAAAFEAKGAVLEQLLDCLNTRGLLGGAGSAAACRLALDEALVNAVMHGCRGDARLKVRVRLYATDRKWTALVEDAGTGFREEDLPDPKAAENLLEESGRGVILIRNCMDEVTYWNRGAALLISRHLDPFRSGGSGGAG